MAVKTGRGVAPTRVALTVAQAEALGFPLWAGEPLLLTPDTMGKLVARGSQYDRAHGTQLFDNLTEKHIDQMCEANPYM